MVTDSRRRVAIAVALAAIGIDAGAQCPDGSQPRNGSCATIRVAAAVVDSHRLAVLPFNTTAVSPSLAHIGTGLAELLASRFSGEFGPEAIESGETYLAWSRSGGAREPLTQQRAMQVARALGAGQAVLGSVVESGGKLIVSASLVRVGDTRARPDRVEIEGTEAELGALTESLAARLQGRASGIAGTHSVEALRAFFDGMAAYRRWMGAEADSHLVRAASLDSTFIEAAYRTTLHRARYGPSLGVNEIRPAFRHLWRNRHRLNAEQRTLLSAISDSGGMARRPLALQRLEKVIQTIPNSADAWAMLGNGYYHMGRLIGREDWAARAKAAFHTALRIDPSAKTMIHPYLAGLAFLEGDARAFARWADTSAATPRYQAAILSGNRERIHTARSAYVEERLQADLDFPRVKDFWQTGAPLPQHEVDTLLLLLAPLATTEQRQCKLANITYSAMQDAGRLARADSAFSESYRICRPLPRDTATFRREQEFNYALNDSAVAEARFREWHAAGDPRERVPLDAMLSRMRRGDTTGVGWLMANRPPVAPADHSVADIIAQLPPGTAAGAVLGPYVVIGVAESFGGSTAGLHKADSLQRIAPRDIGDIWNYDIALAFARHGDYRMAIAAIRRRVMLIATWEHYRHVASLRLEGQWQTVVGDTAAAIKAYREYLLYRESPEPRLVPQRDSVIAELNALSRARRAKARRP